MPAPSITPEQWTAIILTRGPLMRALKGQSEASVERAGFVASVTARGAAFEWKLESRTPRSTIASGKSVLLITACTEAATALVMHTPDP